MTVIYVFGIDTNQLARRTGLRLDRPWPAPCGPALRAVQNRSKRFCRTSDCAFRSCANELARPTGFEPATCSFGGCHSIQLSYGRAARIGIGNDTRTGDPALFSPRGALGRLPRLPAALPGSLDARRPTQNSPETSASRAQSCEEVFDRRERLRLVERQIPEQAKALGISEEAGPRRHAQRGRRRGIHNHARRSGSGAVLRFLRVRRADGSIARGQPRLVHAVSFG